MKYSCGLIGLHWLLISSLWIHVINLSTFLLNLPCFLWQQWPLYVIWNHYIWYKITAIFHHRVRKLKNLLLETQCWCGSPWWRHQMETFSALLALCAGNSPVTGEFPSQRPVTRSFDVFFDLRPNKRLGKRSWGWWFERRSRSLWRHCNAKALRNPLACGPFGTLILWKSFLSYSS